MALAGFESYSGLVMSVNVLTGIPGSGKSLRAAEIIYWKLRTHQPVICNFDINRAYPELDYDCFILVDDYEVSPSFLRDFAQNYFVDRPIREGAITLILDECASPVLFSCRTWQNKNRPNWITFFQQHRKMGFECYLITQDINNLDKAIRAVIGYEINFRKLNDLPFIGAFFNIFRRPMIIGVKYYLPLKTTFKRSARVGSDFTFGLKKYMNLYDTFALFD